MQLTMPSEPATAVSTAINTLSRVLQFTFFIGFFFLFLPTDYSDFHRFNFSGYPICVIRASVVSYSISLFFKPQITQISRIFFSGYLIRVIRPSVVSYSISLFFNHRLLGFSQIFALALLVLSALPSVVVRMGHTSDSDV